MIVRRLLLVTLVTLVTLASSGAAFAQQHVRPNTHASAGAGVHTGAGVHAGAGVHPGHMTLEQQHQQIWNDQMMFEDIMRSRSAGSTAKRGAAQAGHQPTHSPGNMAKAQIAGNIKQHDLAKDKRKTAERAVEERRAERITIARNGNRVASRNMLARDKAAINLLHTAHSELSRADNDYGGSRPRAMTHVAIALHHLGVSAPLTNMSSIGNLPQAQSDRLLREAETHLHRALNSVTVDHNARAPIEAAIHELHTALTLR
jgi:hypothetical protein